MKDYLYARSKCFLRKESFGNGHRLCFIITHFETSVMNLLAISKASGDVESLIGESSSKVLFISLMIDLSASG